MFRCKIGNCPSKHKKCGWCVFGDENAVHANLFERVWKYVWNMSKHNCARVDGTGWRRLIGSPKVLIIFHKRATKYRSLLRKMTYKDKGS